MGSILMLIAFMIAFLCSDMKRSKHLSQKETTAVLMAMGKVFMWSCGRDSGTFLSSFSNCPLFLVEQICVSVWWNILASSFMTSALVVLWIPTAHKFMYSPVVKKHEKTYIKTEEKINRKAIISSFVQFERKCEEMKQKKLRMKKELHF